MKWNGPSRTVLGVLLVTSLAACARDTTSPATGVSAPRLSVQATGNRYVVLFKADGVPRNLATRVQALGGTVAYQHSSGIAFVDGLTPAAAATLATAADVEKVSADAVITPGLPQPGVQATLTQPSTQSQGNPAAALLASWQWNMRDIHADQAWAAGKLGSGEVTVAILDTGIDYDNPDLNGLVDLTRSASFVPSDDSITATFFPTRNVISDYNGHGTNVAAQVSSKAFAFGGVTSRTTLIGVKVLGRSGSGSFSGVLNGVLWAADHGADVANMSLGSAFSTIGNRDFIEIISRTFAYAAHKGMLVVVAAGNSAANLDAQPDVFFAYCSVNTVACVSAVGPDSVSGSPDDFAFYSNFGRRAIDVAAPGGNGGLVTSNWPWGPDAFSWVWSFCSKTLITGFAAGIPVVPCIAGNRISGYIGTSQASPHAAGVAALLVARLGHGRPQAIRAALENTADDLGAPGLDPFFGRGRVNAARAAGL